VTARFTEVGDRVWVLRHPVLDVNVTLVPGGTHALLVDTLSTAGQAAALREAVRELTTLPLVLVNTHHHFDHCFGNTVLAGDPPGPVYAHEVTAGLLRDDPEGVRRRAYEEMREREPELARQVRDTPILAPDRMVHGEATVDLGDRPVRLRHLGRGHTAGDLVVQVPDADLLVAGDLVEQGAPPSFDDGYPVQWPDTVAALLHLATPRTVVVPGHGAVVGTGQVRAQHAELAALAWLIRDGHADGAPVERVAARAPFGPGPASTAVRRGYAELSGQL
jgi:glyoxylase-like metal-dependent hydrolase (beta-lactamase superfamily II)